MKLKVILLHLTILQSLRNICECSSSSSIISTNERQKNLLWLDHEANYGKEL